MKRFIFVTGLAIGFVVGSRMGRAPYESLERTAHRVAEDPEIQRRAVHAKETASRVAQDAAASAQDAVAGAAGAAKERLGGGSSDALDDAAADVAEKSSDSASAGGDAEVGEDRPLSS